MILFLITYSLSPKTKPIHNFYANVLKLPPPGLLFGRKFTREASKSAARLSLPPNKPQS